ncbi:MAG: sensor histidine kinase [Bacillota bacterium]
MSLKKRLIIYIMLIFLFVMVFVGYILISQQKDIFQEEIERRGRLLASTLAKISREPILVYEFSALNQNVLSFKGEKGVIEAKILNNKGRIVASIDKTEEGEFAAAKYLSDSKQSYFADKLLSIEKIKHNELEMGRAVIVLSLDSMNKKINYSVKMIVFILGISFVFLFIFINFASSYLLKPVILLTNLVRKIPDSKFEIEALKKQNPPAELEELYNSIIWMYEEMLLIRKRLIEKTQMATIGKMSAYFAHEIRNPLEAMSGAVEVLKIKGDFSNSNKMFFDIIKEEIATLNSFLDEFLNFTRIKSYSFEKFNLTKLIKDIIILLKPMFKAKNIELVFDFAENEILIEADLNKIKSVITNILLNAKDAIKEKGLVKIELTKKRDLIEIRITDDGQGINKADLDKIFNPFFSTKKAGNGIGLSIAKEIIEAHKGKILVKSTANTIFRIQLPLSEDDINEKNSNS